MNAVAGPSSKSSNVPSSSTSMLHVEIDPATVRKSVPDIIPTVVGEDGLREVPHLFELCQVDDLIALIASMLDRLIAHNDRIPLTSGALTRFHSRAPPTINVLSYLLRIARYTNVEPCCLLILLPYVDKVCARLPSFTISSLTVHRFVIAGVSVGSKALSDAFCTNGRYARVGGVSIAEMNLLEKEFCEAIDWRLTTTGAVLSHYYLSLVHSHPAYRLPLTPPPLLATSPPLPPAPIHPPFLATSADVYDSPPAAAEPSTKSPFKPISITRSSRSSPKLIPAPVKNISTSASRISSPVRSSRLVTEAEEEETTRRLIDIVAAQHQQPNSNPTSTRSSSAASNHSSLLSSTRPANIKSLSSSPLGMSASSSSSSTAASVVFDQADTRMAVERNGATEIDRDKDRMEVES